jgi:tRNA threonylcarbamoyladenosine biosynthesis protein TsaB
VKILAIDTATENCSAALLIDGQLRSRARLLGRGHAEHLLPMVQELLAEAGVALAQLTAIAFGRGPGGFTGVRLAAGVAQGLAYGAGLPVVPVSDLRALAQRVLAADEAVMRVLVCIDARMHEVYWGCFGRCEGLAAARGEERVSAPAAVQIPAAWNGNQLRCSGAGTGFAAYPELKSALSAVLHHVQDQLLPRAAEIAVLAAAEAAAGRFLPAEQALPVYLRDDVTHVPAVPSLN